MQKILSYSLLLFTMLFSIMANADKRKVLFIGNSYTGVNNLPQMVADITTSMGDTLDFDSYTPGGKTAQGHWNDATTKSKIMQGGWDYVVLQFQSQEPSFDPSQVANDVYPYAMSLDSLIKATNSCAETIYYMTWGRKNGDAGNCPFYPPICTYDGMQQRLRESYLLFADSGNSSVSPVGAAWKKMRDTHPTVNLYDADESHPSLNGTYLAACTFYSSLFKKSTLGSQYLPGGVGNGDAFYMQQIVKTVVLDSLENWQSEGSIPDADFVYTAPTSSFNISFLNSSKRFANSLWNFGDGSPLDNTMSPSHTFPNSGPFIVCLEAVSACGKKDAFCQNVIAGPNSTSSYSTTNKIKVMQRAQSIILHSEIDNCQLSIIDLNGRTIQKENLQVGKTIISTGSFAPGVYILKISQDNKVLKMQKLYNY